LRSASRAFRNREVKEAERALNAPRVVLNDRDYLLGAFSAADVVVGATKVDSAGGHRVRLSRRVPSAAHGKHFRTVFREMSTSG
jgi:hypothetical protein